MRVIGLASIITGVFLFAIPAMIVTAMTDNYGLLKGRFRKENYYAKKFQDY